MATTAPPFEDNVEAVERYVEEDDEEGDDDKVQCVCGRTDSFGLMIQCEDCGIWQHGECVNIPNKQLSPKHYYCETCRPHMHPYNRHLLSGSWRTTRKPPRDLVGLGSLNLKTDRTAPSKRKTMNSMEASQSFSEIFQLSSKESAGSPVMEQESDGGASGSAKPFKKRKRAMGVKKRSNADFDASSQEDEDSSQADDYRPTSMGPRGVKRGRYNTASGRADDGVSDGNDSESESEPMGRKTKRPAHGSGSGGPQAQSGDAIVDEQEHGGDGDSDMESAPASQPQRDRPAGRGRMVPKGTRDGAKGAAGKKAGHHASKEQLNLYRHPIDHNHPPGAPVNFADLPPVKPKFPNSKASLGEMCKRARVLKEWAHRMQLNHIPLLELDASSVTARTSNEIVDIMSGRDIVADETSRELMSRLLAGLAVFQEKYGAFVLVRKIPGSELTVAADALIEGNRGGEESFAVLS